MKPEQPSLPFDEVVPPTVGEISAVDLPLGYIKFGGSLVQVIEVAQHTPNRDVIDDDASVLPSGATLRDTPRGVLDQTVRGAREARKRAAEIRASGIYK